jgi:hypothetical protein
MINYTVTMEVTYETPGLSYLSYTNGERCKTVESTETLLVDVSMQEPLQVRRLVVGFCDLGLVKSDKDPDFDFRLKAAAHLHLLACCADHESANS